MKIPQEEKVLCMMLNHTETIHNSKMSLMQKYHPGIALYSILTLIGLSMLCPQHVLLQQIQHSGAKYHVLSKDKKLRVIYAL